MDNHLQNAKEIAMVVRCVVNFIMPMLVPTNALAAKALKDNWCKISVFANNLR